jgi:membrane-associated phospholipid phosphatase
VTATLIRFLVILLSVLLLILEKGLRNAFFVLFSINNIVKEGAAYGSSRVYSTSFTKSLAVLQNLADNEDFVYPSGVSSMNAGFSMYGAAKLLVNTSGLA